MLWLLLLLAACGKAPELIPVSCADPLAGCRLPDGMEVRFSRQPSVMQSFDLDMAAPADSEPYASFQMRGMEMGMNRYRLLRKDGHWHASVMLPACVQGRRDWVLQLDVGGKTYEVPFIAG
jgi:hypothetical protein